MLEANVLEKVGLISLGCAKNLVDSEQMLWRLENAGYGITPDAGGADVVVVNTCAFIDSAKAEAIETVLELAALKETGRLKKIIVTGCLAQRFRSEILTELPEVDGLVGCGSFSGIVEAVRDALDENTGMPQYYGGLDGPVSDAPRVLSTPEYTAYLRIAEGCDNNCAFCVIPSLRGPYRSRTADSLVNEARLLVSGGVKELIVVAQDITRYRGENGESLSCLLRELCRIDGLRWIRPHYMYPDRIGEELLDTIASEPKILHYFDIPIQHADDGLLKRMNRRYGRKDIEKLFGSIRAKMPDAVFRTSLIAGLPGETEDEFKVLCDFLKVQRLERAGVFPYSKEEGTPAADMPGQVDEDTKQRRVEIIMGILQKSQDAYNRRIKRNTLSVLCGGYDPEMKMYYGRSYAESPDVDGLIFFSAACAEPRPGDFADVEIIKAVNGDLVGRLAD